MCNISIVMAVYNAEEHLKECIESVLNQSYRDFEFIIIDDGSTDNTKSIVKSFTDNRIKYIENSHNYIETLNLGISLSRGKYIARMDSDDIMHTDRLRIQFSIMECEPNITVCGSWAYLFSENVHRSQIIRPFTGLMESPLITMILGNPIINPTTMIRKTFIKDHRILYKELECAEDYQLWFDIACAEGSIYIEPQPLLFYRSSTNQVSRVSALKQQQSAKLLKIKIIQELINKNNDKIHILRPLFNSLSLANANNYISDKDFFSILYKLFRNIEV